MQPDAGKRFAVVGATSDVGTIVVGRLTAAGHALRPIARGAGVSMDDARKLRAAFDGVDGAFVMIPFDLQAADLHARERELGEKIAVAIGDVRRVVLLSGLSAELRRGSSLGAALMEERLDALGIPELVHLRAGFFMENFLKGLGFVGQAESGQFATPFRGDRPMPMIAARDVGRRAAELLTEAPFGGSRVVELRGVEHTFVDATAILGAAIGRPDLVYDLVPYASARAGMVDTGMSPSFADAVLETARSFNDGERWGSGAPSDSTGTSLAQWANEALRQTRSV